MGVPVIVLIVTLVGLVVGASVVLGAPILAIPILLLLPGPFVTLSAARKQIRQRKIKRFREQAQAHKTDFRPADKQTLV